MSTTLTLFESQRKADKTEFYITGTLGKGAESVFNVRAHHDHYHARKKLAGAVCSLSLHTHKLHNHSYLG